MSANSSKDALLEKAVEASKQGNPALARQLLLKLLKRDNREPLYWLLMSTTVESREERIYCLQNVLFLDPENSAARHDLKLLDADAPLPHVPAFLPEETEEWHTKEIAAPKIRKRRRKTREKPWSLRGILAALGVGVALILLAYYAAENNLLDGWMDSLGSGSPQAQASPGDGSTAPPSRATATLPVLVPSNPQELLQATYTPTPVYVDTPHPESPSYTEGLQALGAQNWAAAANAFEALLSSNPQAADVAYYLGEAYLGAGNLTAANAAFDRAIQTLPSFAPAYLGRARASLAGSSGDVITDLNTAVLLDANYVDAYLQRAAFNLGRNNLDAAGEDIASAASLAPNSPLVLYYQARLALARGDYVAALQSSQLAHDLDLTLLPNYLAKAEAEQGSGDYPASIVTMQRYLSFNGRDPLGWQLLGLGFEHTGKSVDALNAFDHGLTLDPNLPYASYYHGLQDLEEGRPSSALGYMQIAVNGLPDWFEARIGLARAHLFTGNPSLAFFEINTSSPRVETDQQRAMFFYWRAMSLEALGQNQNALADWRSLLELPASASPEDWRQTAQSRVDG